MTTAPVRRRWGAVLLALALTAAACGDDDDITLDRASVRSTTTTAATSSTTEPSASTTAPPQTTTTIAPLSWESCGGGTECTTVAVPLDHDDPSSGTVDLFVSRLPATGDRIGALFVNFGGPGAGASDLIEVFGFPTSVRERFDIVGMDPRGVGRSTPLDCGIPAAELYRADPTVEDQADADALVAISQRYATDCASARGRLLPHVGTRDVARDMDFLRAAMGDQQLSYLGFSYGTSIGQVYAELFPTRVRAMVLDGVVDPGATGIEFATEQAEGFESALADWAAGCRARGCPLGDDPLAAVDRVLEMAEDGVPSSGGARALGPGEAAVALAYPLYSRSLWGSLDTAIARALQGDGRSMVALADDYIGLVDLAPYFAVSCLDSSWPRSTQELLAASESAVAAAPRFGEAIVNDYLRCAVWPVEPDPLGPIAAPGAPPILVVSTTGDPATPHENGVRVAARLASGVLLTNEGDGHTVTFQGSPCVDAVVVAYLVDLAVPSGGNRCRSDG